MPSDRGETFNPFKPLMISATNFNYILSGWGRSSPLAANFKIFGETTIVRPNLAGAADDLRRDLNYQAIVFAFVALLVCDLVFGVLGRCGFFTPILLPQRWSDCGGVSTIFCAVRHL